MILDKLKHMVTPPLQAPDVGMPATSGVIEENAVSRGSEHPQSPQKTFPVILAILLFAIIIVGTVSYFYLKQTQSLKKENSEWPENYNTEFTVTDNPSNTGESVVVSSPTPTPMPIAKGEQTYYVRSGSKEGPTLLKLIVSEFDPPVGSAQKFTIESTYTGSDYFDSISISLKTDNKKTDKLLIAQEPLNKKQIWTVEYTVDDTHNYLYELEILTKDNKAKTASQLVSFR